MKESWIALNSDRPYSEIALDLGINYPTFVNGVRKAMSTKNHHKINGRKLDKQNYQALEREFAGFHERAGTA